MSGRRAGQGRGTGVAVADRPWHRGERWHWQGAWRAAMVPGRSGSRETRGAGLVLGGRAAKWPGQVASALAYGAAVGVVQGGER
jgi:hypothetical protein